MERSNSETCEGTLPFQMDLNAQLKHLRNPNSIHPNSLQRRGHAVHEYDFFLFVFELMDTKGAGENKLVEDYEKEVRTSEQSGRPGIIDWRKIKGLGVVETGLKGYKEAIALVQKWLMDLKSNSLSRNEQLSTVKKKAKQVVSYRTSIHNCFRNTQDRNYKDHENVLRLWKRLEQKIQ